MTLPGAPRWILIPGYGLGPSSWGPLLAEGKRRCPGVDHQTVSYHYGARGDARRGPVAELAARLRRDLASPPMTLVIAFSLGTAVVGELLSGERPPYLAGVVSLGGLPGPDEMTPEFLEIAAGLTASHEHDRRLVELYAATARGRALVAEELRTFGLPLRGRIAEETRAEPHLPTEGIPWLTIFGTADAMVVPPSEHEIRRRVPEGRVAWVGAGHALHLDAPAATWAAIGGWGQESSPV